MTRVGIPNMNELEKIRQLKSVDFLSFFSEETLERLARSSEVLTIPAHHTLFKEGDASPSMFIILSGEVLVTRPPQSSPNVKLIKTIW